MDAIRAAVPAHPTRRKAQSNGAAVSGSKPLTASECRKLERKIDKRAKALQERPEVLRRLEEERRWSAELIDALGIGLDPLTGRIWIPERGPDGNLRQLARWLPSWNRNGTAPKLISSKGVPRFLFLPAPGLLEEGWAMLTEGAPDALAVASHGIPAIGAPSARWSPEWTEELGRLGIERLYLAPDADESGEQFARDASEALRAAGLSAERIDPGLRDGEDLTDFLAGVGDFEKGRDSLLALTTDADGAEALPFASIEPEHIDFLLPGIPLGMLTILGGNAGLGKSMLTAHWSARVTSKGLRKPGAVMLLSGEDLPGVTRLRLEASGADLSRVFTAQLSEDGEEVGITIPDDLRKIERLVSRHRIRLLVIDPINGFFPSGIDSHRDTDTRRVLGPLASMARRQEIAVVAVTHLNKQRGGDPLQRLLGSVAYGAQARSAFLLDRNPDDPDGEQGTERVLVHAKSNVSPLEGSKLLRVAGAEVDGEETARIELAGDSELSARELLDRNAEQPTHSKTRSAEDAIRGVLADGEIASAKVKELLIAAGFSERTVKRASQSLGVISRREGRPPVSYWRLPEAFPARSDK